MPRFIFTHFPGTKIPLTTLLLNLLMLLPSPNTRDDYECDRGIERVGRSNKSVISKYIESTYSNLPPTHSTLLSHTLNKMKESGDIVLFKNNYMRPDPNALPKRGCGRLPKAKTPLSADAVISPPRPCDRPPKAKDPFAPVAPPQLKKKPAPASPTGRPRGRPPKKPKTDGASTPTAPTAATGGAPRGRGRLPNSIHYSYP